MNSRPSLTLPTLFVPCLALAWCLSAADSKTDELERTPPPDSDVMLGKEPGQLRDDNGLKMKLLWCPPGFLTMEQMELIREPARGEPGGKSPPRGRRVEKVTPVKVAVTRGYWLGKYEVTQSEWKDVMNSAPWKGDREVREGADFPATCVDWENATDLCRKFTEQDRQTGRLSNDWEYALPTEAQWERSCRARTQTQFSFGDDESTLGEYAWFSDYASGAPQYFAQRVGQKKPNPWGLCDMHGNVWECCRDVFSQNLPGGRDPRVTTDEKTNDMYQVIRGGGWNEVPAVCRSARRSGTRPSTRRSTIGFRVALTVAHHESGEQRRESSPHPLRKPSHEADATPSSQEAYSFPWSRLQEWGRSRRTWASIARRSKTSG